MKTYLDEIWNELEIVDADTRSIIDNNTRAPFRWICSIICTYRDANNVEHTDQLPATGLLISPRHVLTAAHVLVPNTGSLKGLLPIRITVTPGHHGASKPFGEYTTNAFKLRNEWRNSYNRQHDYAVIILNEEVGKKKFSAIQTNRLGWWGSCGQGAHLIPMDKDFLKGKLVTVCGYPADKAPFTQWWDDEPLDNLTPTIQGVIQKNRFTYKADTCPGHSGSPVWHMVWGENDCVPRQRFLVGVHTGACGDLDGCTTKPGTGCGGGNQTYSHNRGILLNNEVYNQIQAWLK